MRDRRPRAWLRTVVIAVIAVAVLMVPFAVLTIARWAGEDEVALEPDQQDQPDEPDVPDEPDEPDEPDVPDEPGEPGQPDPEEPTTPAPQPASDAVTEEDDGATFAMHTGDTTALRLSSDWLWEEPRVSGGAVTLARVDHFADPGYAEWQVDATSAGTSEVTVSGSPNCGDEAACPPRSVTFRFAVEG